MQTVEDTKDALLKSCTTHDAVVDYHEVVFVRHDALVGYIVYMRSQVITRVALGDKGAKLYILASHLLRANILAHYIVELSLGRHMVERSNLLNLNVIQVLFETMKQTVVSCLCSIRNV